VVMGPLLFLFSSSPSAVASPVGDPVAHPGTGRVRVDARVGSERVDERDTRCQGNTGCTAIWRRSEIVGGLHVAILPGLGIYGELGRETAQIRAADYIGISQVWAVGLRAAVPLAPNWWIAADGRLGFGAGEGTLQEGETDPEAERYQIHTGSLLGVWGDPSNGADMWLGAQAAWQWKHEVWPLGRDDEGVALDIPLSPKTPVSGVVGGAFYSDPLGAPWRTSIRMNVGIEGRIGQVNGVTGWVGAAL
jgi:hypothetical protein